MAHVDPDIGFMEDFTTAVISVSTNFHCSYITYIGTSRYFSQVSTPASVVELMISVVVEDVTIRQTVPPWGFESMGASAR